MGMGEINLGKEMIWSAKDRRKIYRLMLLYLLLFAILLPLTARRAVEAVSEGLEFLRQTEEIQAQFKRANPGQPALPVFAVRLRDTLQENSKKVSAVGAALPLTTHSVIPVLDLLISQHDNVHLNKLSFIQQNKEKKPELEFSAILPARGGTEAPAFLRNWRNDQRLARQFTAISPATTERGTFLNEEVLITRYKAVWREQ
jgi:hypothetical protein